jgi:hypothetical protein
MLDREKYNEACDILEASCGLATEIGVPTPELLADLTSTLGAIAGASLKPERFDAGLANIILALHKTAEMARDNGQA